MKNTPGKKQCQCKMHEKYGGIKEKLMKISEGVYEKSSYQPVQQQEKQQKMNGIDEIEAQLEGGAFLAVV